MEVTRARISTTVDEALLMQARARRSGATDASILDEALLAFIASRRARAGDSAYRAYDKHPLDEPDEWGDLASFRRAAGRS